MRAPHLLATLVTCYCIACQLAHGRYRKRFYRIERCS